MPRPPRPTPDAPRLASHAPHPTPGAPLPPAVRPVLRSLVLGAALLGAACGVGRPGATDGVVDAADADTGTTATAVPAADHHVHVRSADATRVLLEIQELVGQRIVDEESATELRADDALAALDSAGIDRAALLSVAYFYGFPEVEVEEERRRVRDENDRVAREAARRSDRLVAFCAVNPLAPYALEEVRRCGEDRRVRGIKLHLANSGVDLRDPDHVAALAALFERAEAAGLAIVLHLRTRNPEYGRPDAEIFLREVLPRAPSVPVQLAHLGGWSGFDAATAAAVSAFADAIGRGEAPNVLFDIAAVVVDPARAGGDPALEERVREINEGAAGAIRSLGPERVVFGSDWEAEGIAAYVETVRTHLPLPADTVARILANEAPYLSEGR